MTGSTVAAGFTDDERAMILAHGPWPPPLVADASNRIAQSPAGIDFGKVLFFTSSLSRDGKVSCATCHRPAQHWSDGRKLGLALDEVERNTPTLENLRYSRWFGWDGANDSLWAQSFRPLIDAREHGLEVGEVAARVRADADLVCRYRKAFGETPPADDERVLVDIGKALAAFIATLVTGRTPFDDFRDALERGDASAAAAYPQPARRGLKIFAGRGRCSLCHFGPSFTHGEFHEIGIPIQRKSGGVDWGRYQGIKLLSSSRFNLLGPYNDDPVQADGQSTRHVDLVPQTFEQFKVPSMRNVAGTAPYMHNGHLPTLERVVRHYSEIDPASLHVAHVYLGDQYGLNEPPPTDTVLRPLKLSDAEIADVVAFLGTLSERPRTEPPAERAAAPCRP